MELPQRKSTRLKSYDYSQNGVYFITICTANRKTLFSQIVGALHEEPELQLSTYGNILKQYILELPKRYKLNIDQYVIMPDHVHLLLRMEARAIHESPLRDRSE